MLRAPYIKRVGTQEAGRAVEDGNTGKLYSCIWKRSRADASLMSPRQLQAWCGSGVEWGTAHHNGLVARLVVPATTETL